MKYRVDEKSGNKLSVLGLGCMRFPRNIGMIDMENTEAIVLNSIEQGVNYFDTAYIYAGSESALGDIIARNNVRDGIYLATKLPIVYCKKYEDFDKFFNKQLEHLKTDHIDYYLMHMIQDCATWKSLCSLGIEEWIQSKKSEGLIRQIGFSFHGSQNEFLSVIDAYDWEFCQIQYNYVNEYYQAGVAGLRKAAAKKIPVIVMEPLLGGKLVNGLPAEAVKIFKSVAPDLSPVAWALRWLWNQPDVTVVLSGMNNNSQLIENINIANNSEAYMLKKEELEAFKKVIEIFNSTCKIACTGCNYCMPCPKNVNIPACFAAYNASFAMGTIEGLRQYIMGTGLTSNKQSSAGLCVKCGRCEKLCPQNIQIVTQIENVYKKMEPFWYKIIASITRKILSK